MTLWAVVPVKPLQQAKSRLAPVLTDAERVGLCRRMLSQTLEALAGIPEITTTMVVSGDPEVRELASAAGARPLSEPEPPDLNRALRTAQQAAHSGGATRLLIVSADLPNLAAHDLRAILRMAGDPPSLVIAPDRHQQGTNALLVAPPGLIEFEFGMDSFARHVERARRAGAGVEICVVPALSFDLDTPQDLELLRSAELLIFSED